MAEEENEATEEAALNWWEEPIDPGERETGVPAM